MTTLLELVEQTPTHTFGVVTQINSGTGSWRWVVELADPAAGASVEWYDITADVDGVELTRGADVYAGRYRAGIAELEISGSGDEYAPTNEDTSATFGTHVDLGAGLLIRAGFIRVTGGAVAEWLPRFTHRVETWGNASYARGQIRLHRVTTRDLLTELVGEPYGNDLEDNWVERVEHLLTEASWSFGSTIYGADKTSGAADILTEPDLDEGDNAATALDGAMDPAGIIWYTTRKGQFECRPVPGESFHADAFTAGASGNEWTDPATVVFAYNAEDTSRAAYIVDDTGTPFEIADTERAVINRVRVTDPVGPVYDTDDPTSQTRYGNRTRSVSWVVENDTVADEIVDRLAYATKQATPLETSIDHAGFFPQVAGLDFLHPVQVEHRTTSAGDIVTATGVVRQLVERFSPRAAETINWDVTVTIDIDSTTEAAELLPVESLSADTVNPEDALFSWTNPSQSPAPTETWVRIPSQSTLWLELHYPMTSLAWLGLEPETAYQFDVRLVRRVDGLIVAASTVESVAFTTPAPVAGEIDPDGSDGWDVTLPDVDDPVLCEIDWTLEYSSDGTTWTTHSSGTGDGGDVINFADTIFTADYIWKFCVTEVCDGVPGTEYCTSPSVAVCQTPPDYEGTLADPYDSADLLAFIPEICPPDVVREAVSDTAGYHGPAWGGITVTGTGEYRLVADGDGIIAYGNTTALDYTGVATIGVKASVGSVASERLFSIAGLRIDAVAGTTGWYPKASITTIYGDEASVTDTTERALDTQFDVLASYDPETGELRLDVDGSNIGSATVDEAAARAAAGDYWYVAGPDETEITSAAVWGAVVTEAPATAPSFFGQYAFDREFCAEDPDWTNPGDGNDIVTIRCNGAIGSALTAAAIGGGGKPTYQASTINSKPGYEFHATSSTVGGNLQITSGTSGTEFSIIVVGRMDNGANFPYFTDDASGSNRLIIGAGAGSTWRGYNTSGLFTDAGTRDTNPHVFVLYVTTNDLELWVDGTSIGTDTAGTVGNATGFTLGSDKDSNSECLNGYICYAAVYPGDITAQTGYSDWLDDIKTYYGIT